MAVRRTRIRSTSSRRRRPNTAARSRRSTPTSGGIRICEHLPKLAANFQHFALLRSVTHSLAAHELGTQYVLTGNRPLASLQYPSYGSVVSKELKGPRDLPPFVAIPNSSMTSGFLGVQYSALSTSSVPRPGQKYGVRGISLGNGLTVADVEKRQHLLSDLDQTFRKVDTNSSLLDGLDRFGREAYEIITSRRARTAFDVSKESPAFAEPFGKSPFGMSCLLATRLVEAGVRFVTVSFGGWDTHFDNWNAAAEAAVAALGRRPVPPWPTGSNRKGLLGFDRDSDDGRIRPHA